MSRNLYRLMTRLCSRWLVLSAGFILFISARH